MFVKRTNYNRPLASVLLIFFLITSILSQSTGTLGSCLKAYGFVIVKSKTSSSSAFQFLYEKTEKEEKKSEDKSISIYTIDDSELFTVAESQGSSFYADPESCGNSTHPRLYLFNRTLLI
jgi:hypothetical protein